MKNGIKKPHSGNCTANARKGTYDEQKQYITDSAEKQVETA